MIQLSLRRLDQRHCFHDCTPAEQFCTHARMPSPTLLRKQTARHAGDIPTRSTLTDVAYALTKQCDDVLIVHAVIHFFAVTPRLDQSHLAQAAEVW